MARKSRRGRSKISVASPVFATASYLRISNEDPERAVSESIENQRLVIQEFLKEKTDLKLVKEFIDDGYSGVHFERPGFQSLLKEVKAGTIRCIIVKDLSRLGRNFEETEAYLSRIFPSLGTRFLSVLEDYDSASETAFSMGLTIALYNLLNDYYAKEVSYKVSRAFTQLKENGAYIGPRPPYGYRMDPDQAHHLIPDPNTKWVVREIFARLDAGQEIVQVLHWLNESAIWPPFRYFYEQGWFRGNRYQNVTLWRRSTLLRIARNPVYCGDLVLQKYRRSLYHNISYQPVPREEWQIYKGTHASIVSRLVFDRVQEKLTETGEE